MNRNDYLILTPGGDPNNPYAGPQEYLLFDEGKGAPPPTPAVVPEPGTLALLATGILGVAGALRRRAKSVRII